MTKAEIAEKLRSGEALANILELRSGDECEIFKSDRFLPGNTVLYIPDLWLNELVINRIASEEEIQDIIDNCYSGADFIAEAEGDLELAKRLFMYCNWQHPSSALPELEELDK